MMISTDVSYLPHETVPVPVFLPAQPIPALPVRSARYQSLDMWRGLACLMLVVYHATFYASHSWRSFDPTTWTVGGLAVNLMGRLWIGVPIFFVVSGYCIAASSDASRRRTHSTWVYFARRFRRIYPPLWIAYAVCLLWILLVSLSPSIRDECFQLPHLTRFSFGNWFGNLTATESWRPIVGGGDTQYLLKNSWTLCYEEQFYAVVGLMLLAASRRFYLAAIVVTVLTLMARHMSRAAGTSLAGFFCDGHWLIFALGILVYYQLHAAPRRRLWGTVAALAAVMGYAALDFYRNDSAFERHLDEYLFVAALFALVLMGLYVHDQRLMALPWLRPLTWCGKRSYSIYLTHFPVVVVLGFALSRLGTQADWFVAAVTVPLSIAVSVLLGWAFHWSVERHFMNAPLDARRAPVVGQPSAQVP